MNIESTEKVNNVALLRLSNIYLLASDRCHNFNLKYHLVLNQDQVSGSSKCTNFNFAL